MSYRRALPELDRRRPAWRVVLEAKGAAPGSLNIDLVEVGVGMSLVSRKGDQVRAERPCGLLQCCAPATRTHRSWGNHHRYDDHALASKADALKTTVRQMRKACHGARPGSWKIRGLEQPQPASAVPAKLRCMASAFTVRLVHVRPSGALLPWPARIHRRGSHWLNPLALMLTVFIICHRIRWRACSVRADGFCCHLPGTCPDESTALVFSLIPAPTCQSFWRHG